MVTILFYTLWTWMTRWVKHGVRSSDGDGEDKTQEQCHRWRKKCSYRVVHTREQEAWKKLHSSFTQCYTTSLAMQPGHLCYLVLQSTAAKTAQLWHSTVKNVASHNTAYATASTYLRSGSLTTILALPSLGLSSPSLTTAPQCTSRKSPS